MSRLRRLLVSRHVFFITCKLLRTRTKFTENDFEALAAALAGVRGRRGYLLAGYVFMPDHWHAIIAPSDDYTLPNLINAVKVSSMRRINSCRHTRGALWQPRYFDIIIWKALGFYDTLTYMHLNPVRKGLVARPEDWLWSSIHSLGGRGPVRLETDRLNLPADEDMPL